ncbi:MAG: class I SAM-dependent methyltransferase, partial [Haliea sp.]
MSEDAWAWSVFWQANHLQAFLPAENPAAMAPIDASWTQFMASVPQPGRILDVGTGNGALAALCWRAHAGASEVHGVDSAAIAPTRYVSGANQALASVHFHPQVRAEALPFADCWFDAVVGQFALEYSDTAASTAEVVRVLRANGHFKFLLHGAGTVVERRNRLLCEQAGELLHTTLFED